MTQINQIKIFEDGEVEILETEINKWLGNNPNIEIIDFKQSESAIWDKSQKDMVGNTTISILYRNPS